MRREVALGAEVARSRHNSRAEEKLPELIHGDPGGQGMIGGEKPSGEGETVRGGISGKGRQGRGCAGVNLLVFLRRIVGSPVQDVGHPLLLGRIVAHYHRGGFSGGEGNPVQFREEVFGAGLPILGGGLGEESIADEEVLLVAARHRIGLECFAGAVGHAPVDLGRREAPVIDPHIVELALEKGSPGTAADPKRHRVLDRCGKRFGPRLDAVFAQFPIDIDLDVLGLAAAVVGHGDVLPLVERNRLVGDDLDGVLRPIVDDVHTGRPCSIQKSYPR